MNGTIEVQGKAKISSPADITVVNARVYGIAEDFGMAFKALAEITRSLRDAVEKAGIPRNDLRTSGLSVKQHFKEVKAGKDKNGNDKFRKVADGFEYSQRVSYEFPNDNEKLSKSIWNISKCDIEPEIDFHYRSSDSKKMRNLALAKAAENARAEAETILGAVGARLGKLVEVRRRSRTYDDEYDDEHSIMCNCCYDAEPVFDIEPEDETFCEDVTMEWEIAD